MQPTVLSTADVARLFNVTETTVKRWADEGTLKCQKTPGGHRKYPLRNVIAFAEENNFEPSGILEFATGDPLSQKIQTGVLTGDFPLLATLFAQKILSPEKGDIAGFLSYLYSHRIQLAEIYDRIVRPGMAVVGDKWMEGEIDVAHEHRASSELIDAMAKLQSHVKIKPPNGLKALIACPEAEAHEIGARSSSYVLESEGWDTRYLGPRTPASSIILAVKELRPDLVCLSLTHTDQMKGLVESIRQIVETTHALGGKVVVGGGRADDWRSVTGVCDASLTSLQQLLDLSLPSPRNDPPGIGAPAQ